MNAAYSLKMNALLGKTGVSRSHYIRALERISQLGITIPARRRAAFGYALALQDVEQLSRQGRVIEDVARGSGVLIGTLLGIVIGVVATYTVIYYLRGGVVC